MLLEARVAQATTEAEAVRLALELYGLEAAARALPGEYDDNFHLNWRGRTCVCPQGDASGAGAFVYRSAMPGADSSGATRAAIALPASHRIAAANCLLRLQRRTASTRLVWLLTFVDGNVLAEVRPHTPELLGDLGRFLGEMDAALQVVFTRRSASRIEMGFFAGGWIKEYVKHIEIRNGAHWWKNFWRFMKRKSFPTYAASAQRGFNGDANDHNVLVNEPWPQPRKVVGVIDLATCTTGSPRLSLRLRLLTPFLGKKIHSRQLVPSSRDTTARFRWMSRSCPFYTL